MARRTIRTQKTRRILLAQLAATGSVEKACAAAGIGRSAAYAWRRECEEFRAEWNNVIDGLVDEAEAKLFDQARNDDGPAGVTSRLVLLRAHRPLIYNRGLALRHEMMQLTIEEKRRTL